MLRNAAKVIATRILQIRSHSSQTLVESLYQGILQRNADPGGLTHYSSQLDNGVSLAGVIRTFIESDEFKSKSQLLPQLLRGYSDEDVAVLYEFARKAAPQPGFIVDFLGVRTRATSVWAAARQLNGRVLDVPIPRDFHAEAIEWLGLLKSVKTARDRYVAMELGAGFGPWVVAGGIAARDRGIRDIRLYAIEGDPVHYACLRQHLSDNSFDPDRQVLLESAVGVANGTAQWPIVSDSVEHWGMRPIFAEQELGHNESFSQTREVRVIAMRDLVLREDRWDLIHIDIQGHEHDICNSCIEDLNDRVHWIVVGTHSRKIDGDMLQLLTRAHWELEHEQPTTFQFRRTTPLEAMTTIDGTQVWRNPRHD
jgi:FkbM family methyltransferase